MNIGIDARMISATGIGRYTKSLIENLAILDKQNDYSIFLKKGDINKIDLPKNFKKIEANFHWYGLSEQFNFPRLIKKHKVELMHFPHFNVPFFYRGSFVATIHDLTLNRYKTVKATTKSFFVYQMKHFLYKIIIRKAIKKAKKIFSPSEFTKQDIIKFFNTDKDKIVVTLEGGSSEALKSLTPDSRFGEKHKLGSNFILYVGNAYPHKNLDILINVMEKIDSRIKLVLAGKEDYFYQLLKKKVLEKGLDSRIIFPGFVTDKDLAWLYRNARAYIFPSLNEGFGLPLLEAASFGLPIVCSQTSSLPEVMDDSALYFDPNNYNDIAEKVTRVLSDDGLRIELTKKGLERVKFFSWSKMAQQTLAVYNKILKP